MSQNFKQHVGTVVASNKDGSSLGQEILAYARKGLAWAFGERLASAGFFQHSFVPDFSVTLGNRTIDIHLRSNPYSCIPLIDSLGASATNKRVIIVLDSFDKVEAVYPDLNQYRNRKTVLITSVEAIEFLHGLAGELSDAGLTAEESNTSGLLEQIHNWFDVAQGVIPGTELEAYCRDQYRAVGQRSTTPQIPGSLTFKFTSDRAKRLAQVLVDNSPLRNWTVQFEPLHGSKDIHPLASVADAPHLVLTYQAFDACHTIAALSVSQHLPLGMNAYQDFMKAVASASLQVPFFALAPHSALINRSESESSVESASPLLYHAYLRLWDIYQTPVVAIPWPTDPDGLLLLDEAGELPPVESPGMQQLVRLIAFLVRRFSMGAPMRTSYRHMQHLDHIRLNMESKRLARGITYLSHPPLRSLHYQTTDEWLEEVEKRFPKIDSSPALRLLRTRPHTIMMRSRSKVLRADPYAGALSLYDFAFCRYGRAVSERRRNLGIAFETVVLRDALSVLFGQGGSVRQPSLRTARMFLEQCDFILLGDAIMLRDSQGVWTVFSFEDPEGFHL